MPKPPLPDKPYEDWTEDDRRQVLASNARMSKCKKSATCWCGHGLVAGDIYSGLAIACITMDHVRDRGKEIDENWDEWFEEVGNSGQVSVVLE